MAKRVLIADDDAAIRRLLELTLGERFHVTSASDGVQALDFLHHSPPFDCLVLDVTMPHKGGLEVLKEMRGVAELSSVPVIILTAHDSAHVSADLEEVGPIVFISKPFDRKALRLLICELTGSGAGDKGSQVAPSADVKA